MDAPDDARSFKIIGIEFVGILGVVVVIGPVIEIKGPLPFISSSLSSPGRLIAGIGCLRGLVGFGDTTSPVTCTRIAGIPGLPPNTIVIEVIISR